MVFIALGAGMLRYSVLAAYEPKPMARKGTGAKTGEPAKAKEEIKGRFDAAVKQFMGALEDGLLTKVDRKKNTVSIRWMDRITLGDIPVAPKARIVIDGKDRNFTDLRAGMRLRAGDVALEGGEAREIWALTVKENDRHDFRLDAVDAKKRTITVKQVSGGN